MNPKKATEPWRYDRQLLGLLISPSWFSGLLCAFASLGITATLLIQERYQGSEWQHQLFTWQQQGIDTSPMQALMHLRYTPIGGALGTVQLFIFWYLVGLVLYALGSALYNTFQHIRTVKRDLGYVNADRHYILRDISLQLLRQLVSFVLWVLLMLATLKIIIPYALGTIHISNEFLPSIEAIGLLAATTAGLALCMHLHLVLLRLFLGRPRLWHNEEYIDSYDHLK